MKLYCIYETDPLEAIKVEIEKKTCVITSEIDARRGNRSNFYLAAIDPNAILMQPLPHSFMHIFAALFLCLNELALCSKYLTRLMPIIAWLFLALKTTLMAGFESPH